MAGWHHQLDGHEFEQALGVGDGQGRLACCSPWGHKELDMTVSKPPDHYLAVPKGQESGFRLAKSFA